MPAVLRNLLLALLMVASATVGVGIWQYSKSPSAPVVVAQVQDQKKEPVRAHEVKPAKRKRILPQQDAPKVNDEEKPDPAAEPPQEIELPQRFFPGGKKGFGPGPGPGKGKREVPLSDRLGLRVEKPSEELALQLGLAEGDGLMVEHVRDNTTAANAGMKAGDLLLQLGGRNVPNDPEQFNFRLGDLKAGEPIEATLLREGKMLTLKGIVVPEADSRFPFLRRFE